MKIRKLSIGAVTVLLTVTSATCSNSKSASESSDGYTSEELNVQLAPSVQTSKLGAKAKPLQGLLEEQLHMPVHVTVSTDNPALVEAMASKKIDIGFLPPSAYVLAHKRDVADILFQAQRYGYGKPGGEQNHKLIDSHRSVIVVRKGSKIKSWEGLKGKIIAVQDPASTSGYVLPITELRKKDLDVPGDCKLIQVKRHDQAVLPVYNGDADVTFVFPDTRPPAAKDAPAAMEDVVPIYFARYISDDTVSVRGGMSKSFRKKLAKAFENIAGAKRGKKILENIYQHYGYVDFRDSNLNIVRECETEAKKAQK